MSKKTVIKALSARVEQLEHELQMTKAKLEVSANRTHDQARENMKLRAEMANLRHNMGGPVVTLEEFECLLNPEYVRRHKINSIKIIRRLLHVGLKEAKEIVEGMVGVPDHVFTEVPNATYTEVLNAKV